MAEPKPEIRTGRIVLDAADFTDVVFRDATLVYSGGRPPRFLRCGFDRATFSFEGPAGNTLQLLKNMAPATTHMRPIVQGLLPELAD